jgi:hypothetical protein
MRLALGGRNGCCWRRTNWVDWGIGMGKTAGANKGNFSAPPLLFDSPMLRAVTGAYNGQWL